MTAATINIQTDSEIKVQAQAVFERLGLDMSSAINAFLQQTIRQQDVPFDLKAVPPTQQNQSQYHSILRSLCGSIDDPTFVEPPEIEYESPREEII